MHKFREPLSYTHCNLYVFHLFQDVSVLKDIVDSVSPTIPPEWEEDSEDEEDDEERMRRIKAQIKVKVS